MGGPILVIEDDAVLRELMHDWLETVFLDCDVIVASQNDGAIAITTARSPRVVLIDVDTLGADRVDVVRRVKEAAPRAEVIALTMDDHEALREDVEAAGAGACVSKANINDELLPMLQQLIGPGDGVRGRERTVLCIEDELEMIKLIEFTLQRGPFRVVGAVSGQQGLEMARRVQPDVVLLDLMMPDMDGWEVARRMRQDEALRDVPIIAVSVVHPSDRPARELDVDDYVTKPFRPDDLVERVSAVARVVA